jgi:hypothetical protein
VRIWQSLEDIFPFFLFLICARDGLQGTMKRGISDKLFLSSGCMILFECRDGGSRGKEGQLIVNFSFLSLFCVFFCCSCIFLLQEHAHLASFACLTLVLAGREWPLKSLETANEPNQLMEGQVHVHSQFGRTFQVWYFELPGERVALIG